MKKYLQQYRLSKANLISFSVLFVVTCIIGTATVGLLQYYQNKKNSFVFKSICSASEMYLQIGDSRGAQELLLSLKNNFDSDFNSYNPILIINNSQYLNPESNDHGTLLYFCRFTTIGNAELRFYGKANKQIYYLGSSLSLFFGALFALLYSLLQKHWDKQAKTKTDLEVKTYQNNIARQFAHDIKSPLSVLNLISSNPNLGLTSDIREILDGVVSRINKISNDLLYIGSAATEPLRQNEQKILLSQVISTLINEKRFFLPTHIDIIFSNLTTIEPKATIAQSDFERLLSNLLNNSIEAMGEKGGSITLDLTAQDSFIQLKVTDAGIGIPQHVLQKIGKEAISTKSRGENSGSGIGLLGAYEIMRIAGGSIKIDSQINLGTTVTLLFRV